MTNQFDTGLVSRCLRAMALVGLALSLATPADAQVRRSVAYSSFVNPAAIDDVVKAFAPTGIWRIAGGVVFEGRAAFHLEDGSGVRAVPASSVSLAADRTGEVFLLHGGARYRLEIHRGLACPLATFVDRGGRIAFTIPESDDSAASMDLLREGIVNQEIAREFADTEFEDLLLFTDLFSETEPLPDHLATRILASVRSADGSRADIAHTDIGSYINADYQVTYQVYLVPGAGRAETSGVPLRYHWHYGTDDQPVLTRVEVLSQSWPSGTSLANLAAGEEPTQYDAVSLFQNAAVFRQMRLTNADGFRRFVAAACAR